MDCYWNSGSYTWYYIIILHMRDKMKKYLRCCDVCEKEINPYDEGTITLYRDIRFGVGGRYKDFMHKNGMAMKATDDYDFFGKRLTSDVDNEFSFCCLDHCLQFICEAHTEVNKETKKK